MHDNDDDRSAPTAYQTFHQLPKQARTYLTVLAAAIMGVVLVAANQFSVPSPGAATNRSWLNRWLPMPWSMQQVSPLDRATETVGQAFDRAAQRGEKVLDRVFDGIERRRQLRQPAGLPVDQQSHSR